jgi:hypothetical protein
MSILQDTPEITVDGESRKLRPMTDTLQAFIVSQIKAAEGDDRNSAFVIGYALAAGLPGIESVRMSKDGTFMDEVQALAIELSEGDTQAVIDYLTQYFQRRNEANFSLPESAKKQTRATRRPRK